MGQHGLDVLGAVGGAQQVVAHQQADLADHMAGGVQEHVQRARDHALVGILHAHHAVLRAARGRGVEHLVEAVAVHQVGRAAEVLDGCLLAERALGAQHGHALGRFQRQAGRHDLAPDGGHVCAFERAGVGFGDLLDHLGDAVGAEVGRALALLQLAHLLGHAGALVEKLQQLVVQRIDLHAQIGQRGAGLGCGA